MGTTSPRGMPYPEPGDLVTNGAAAIEALAERVDNQMPGHGAFSAFDAGAFTVPNLTFTALPFTETADPDGAADGATGAYVAPIKGIYLLAASITFGGAVSSSIYRLITGYLTPVGGGGAVEVARAAAGEQNGAGCAFAVPLLLNVGDLFEFKAYQDSGGPMGVANRALGATLLRRLA